MRQMRARLVLYRYLRAPKPLRMRRPTGELELATALVILLQALLLAPLVYAAVRRPESISTLGFAYGGAFVVLIAAGSFAFPAPASLSKPVPPPQRAAGGSIDRSACSKALGAAEQLGMISRPQQGRLPVEGRLWDQLPTNAQLVLLQCASEIYVGGKPLELLRQ
jgi:hypothetical protein